jgi:hypothetical protein
MSHRRTWRNLRGGLGLHALLPDGNGSFYVGSKAHFEIPVGERTTVWVPLTEGARQILANKRKLTARVFSEILAGVSEVKVTIVAPRNGEAASSSGLPLAPTTDRFPERSGTFRKGPSSAHSTTPVTTLAGVVVLLRPSRRAVGNQV